MADLYKNYDADIYDGLIINVVPPVVTGPGTIAALSEETTLKRGTVLAKASNGKLSVLSGASGSTAYGILCDETVVGTSDVKAVVYLAGSFDPAKLIVADGYTMTAGDIDALRNGGIFLKAQIDADAEASN